MIFTETTYRQFKKRYEQARNNNEESFMFKGHEFLTNYAKYLLEYIKLSIRKL